MRIVALILGVLCFGAAFAIAESAQSVMHEMMAGIVVIVGVLFFVLTGVLEVKWSVDRFRKSLDKSVERDPRIDSLVAAMDELRADMSQVRKIKEAEWRRANPAK